MSSQRSQRPDQPADSPVLLHDLCWCSLTPRGHAMAQPAAVWVSCCVKFPSTHPRQSACFAKEAVLKRLRVVPWRAMQIKPMGHEGKALPERLSKACRTVSCHRETAALFRAIKGKSRHDRMTPRADTSGEPLNISDLIRRVHKEVEDGAIMPDVIGPRRLPTRDVANNPFHRPSARPQPGKGCRKCIVRQIKR